MSSNNQATFLRNVFTKTIPYLAAILSTTSCNHNPQKDYTTLKRDLLELGQHCQIRYTTGLVAPIEFAHDADRLANDYRLQREPRPKLADTDIRRVIVLTGLMRTSAAIHLQHDPQDHHWQKLVEFHGYLTNTVPIAVTSLELDESSR